MNTFDNLLRKIANEYQIPKGEKESDDNWKMRIIYSICGMMAYASLWDDDPYDTVSITHVKKRINMTLVDYGKMYPELSIKMPSAIEELEDEIVGQFMDAGVVYHQRDRIIPSMKKEVLFSDVLFQRGISVDNISAVSGLGFYSQKNEKSDIAQLRLMFGLEDESLEKTWKRMESMPLMDMTLPLEGETEYLRQYPPFSKGYWTDKPDTTGALSILRTGMRGSRMYYLYRFSNNMLRITPLPKWEVEESSYRKLASACLLNKGTLPTNEYHLDGKLVSVTLNYLLPPREMNLLKLYSWPGRYTDFPCDFKRELSVNVFFAIKAVLTEQGYRFEEV